MKNIYFAMLYYKTKPEKDIYDFIPLYALVGVYDEEKKKFISSEGKEYPLISNKEFLNSKKRSAVENLISLEECQKNFKDEQDLQQLRAHYEQTFKKVYFLSVKKENEFFTIRYHEYMLLVGIGHLKGLVEIEEKQNFKRNLAKYGILAHTKIEKEK